MATVTAMAAQVKRNVVKVAHDTTNIKLCIERTLRVAKKDLVEQEGYLCNHAQALTVKEVFLTAQKNSIQYPLKKMNTQLQELKRESNTEDSVIQRIQALTKKYDCYIGPGG